MQLPGFFVESVRGELFDVVRFSRVADFVGCAYDRSVAAELACVRVAGDGWFTVGGCGRCDALSNGRNQR